MKHANIALFVPHNGCRHQCSFCNQRSITGCQLQPTPQDVLAAIQVAKSSLGGEACHAEIAFFGGSFTALERGYMVSLLDTASPFINDGTFAGIRISTRPDAITDEILALLQGYGVTSIELGAQSMDDRVLRLNERGHTAEQVEQASEQIRKYGFSLGLQMMTGLFGDTVQGAVETAHKLAALSPETVRIYPTIIMRGTELGQKYLAGEFQTLSLDETVSLCAGLLDFFESRSISVIRLGLHSSLELERDMLSGPWHPAFRELCESRRMLQKMTASLEKDDISQGHIIVGVNPKSLSAAIGQHKSNLITLKELGYDAKFVQDESVRINDFILK